CSEEYFAYRLEYFQKHDNRFLNICIYGMMRKPVYQNMYIVKHNWNDALFRVVVYYKT
ncbi:hypothetical protein L9F63_011836, partial [Diploptera punctata]